MNKKSTIKIGILFIIPVAILAFLLYPTILKGDENEDDYSLEEEGANFEEEYDSSEEEYDPAENFTSSGIIKELKEKRTLYSKTFLEEDGSYQEMIGIGPVHYPDESGNLEDIDTDLISSDDSVYNYEVTRGFYKVRFKKDFTSENLVEYHFRDFTLNLWFQNLTLSNEEGGIETVSAPQPVNGEPQGNMLKYSDAYGPGIDVELLYHPQYLGKYLVINSFDSLPAQNFSFLEFNFKISISDNLDIYIDDQKWDGQETIISEKTEFKDKKTGETQFFFKKAYVEDSQGDESPIAFSLKKEGSNIVFSKKISREWLEQASYPIEADALQTIPLEGDAYDMYVEGGTTDHDSERTVWVVNARRDKDGYWAFQIPGTIINATITRVTFTGYNTENEFINYFRFYGLQKEDCPALEGAEQPATYSRTTASVHWVFGGMGSRTSPDLKSIFNEWVQDYTHANSPDRFGLVLDSATGGNNRDARFRDYSHHFYANNTYLTIYYTIPANTPPNDPSLVLNFTYADVNYTNESMWCEIYVNDINTENDMSVDIIIMNSTTNNIATAVEQYALPNAFTGLSEPTRVQFEINEQNFTKGDFVWCQARTYDQENYSGWVNSTSLKVENYPVKISSPVLAEDDESYPENQIDLTAGSTELVTCSAKATDADGHEDVISASAFFYDSGEGETWDSQDGNNSHYTNTTCYLSNGAGYTKDITCMFELWYYANNSTWECNITATDKSNLNGSGADSTEIQDMIALDIPTILDYGNLKPGDTSAEKIITVTNVGNTPIDIGLDGYGEYDGDGNAMNCEESESISLSYERYNISEPGADYGTEMTELTDANVVQYDFDLLERGDDIGNSTKGTYWKIKAPVGIRGACHGVITVLASSG